MSILCQKNFLKEDRYWAKEIDNNHTYLYDPSLRCHHNWTKNGAT